MVMPTRSLTKSNLSQHMKPCNFMVNKGNLNQNLLTVSHGQAPYSAPVFSFVQVGHIIRRPVFLQVQFFIKPGSHFLKALR